METTKASVYLESNLKEKDSTTTLKLDFFLRADPSIFTSLILELFDWSNKAN